MMNSNNSVAIARAYRVPPADDKRNSAGSIQATRLSIGRTYQQQDDKKQKDITLTENTNNETNGKSKFIDICLGFKNGVESHTIEIPHSSKCTFKETKGSKASVPVKVNATFHGILSGHIHESEIQSVESAPIVRGNNKQNILTTSIDAFGTLKASINKKSINLAVGVDTIQKQIYREASWSGISLNCTATELKAVTAHFSSRMIQTYDLHTGKITNQFLSALPPLAINYVNDTQILCAESHFVSLYDLRSNKLVGRISPSKGFLYSLALPSSLKASDVAPSSTVQKGSNHSNILLATGEDRIVYGIDKRTWKIRHRWRAPLKYEAIQLLSSPTMPTTCYAVGLDNDILCGRWKAEPSTVNTSSYKNILFQNHHCGFRGDSRWVGMSIFNNVEHYDQNSGDVIVAASESGSLYVVENADNMQQSK